ncbi:MAG: GNAT family N-acetyltransferase, partial [Planctomycetes bacterium]|nr:GNAT family N-acetyltransferase [Planctomycetota bacterium]
MPAIDLTEFETKIRVRPLQISDFEDLRTLQGKCFPGMSGWKKEQIESQLATFPEGQLVVEYDGVLVASSSSLIVDGDAYTEWHNWAEISDGGYIRNHTPKGDTLYGIEIMVDPEYRGLKLSRRLYDARKQICRHRNLKRIIIAGRIPNYHKQADRYTPREYAEQVMNKAVYDPVLTAQTANGFVLKGL